MSQNDITDVDITEAYVSLVRDNVLESSNLVPMAQLSAAVDDVEAVLEDSSDAQSTFVQQLKDTLGVNADSIAISGLRRLSGAIEQDAGGRRRTQTTGEVTFGVQITGPDAIAALTTLSEQVADPDSALRISVDITSGSPVFSFICPVGTELEELPEEEDGPGRLAPVVMGKGWGTKATVFSGC